MEALFNEKAVFAVRPFRTAKRPSKAYQVEMKGQGFSSGDKRNHPMMRLLCVHPLRNEAETCPDPEHMGVDREGFSSKAKKEETVNGLWPNPFKTSYRFVNLAGFHLLQDSET